MRIYTGARFRDERGGIIMWRIALVVFLGLACLSFFVHSSVIELVKAIAAGIAAVTLLTGE